MRQIEIFGIILITDIFTLWNEPESSSPALTSACNRARAGRVLGRDFQDSLALIPLCQIFKGIQYEASLSVAAAGRWASVAELGWSLPMDSDPRSLPTQTAPTPALLLPQQGWGNWICGEGSSDCRPPRSRDSPGFSKLALQTRAQLPKAHT